MTPTARTLQFLRNQKIPAQVVEKWVRFDRPVALGATAPTGPPGVRKDLFGLWDIVALRAGRIVGIQCCSMSTRASHMSKLIENPMLDLWLAGGDGEVWAWRKLTPKGKRARWEPDVSRLCPSLTITTTTETL